MPVSLFPVRWILTVNKIFYLPGHNMFLHTPSLTTLVLNPFRPLLPVTSFFPSGPQYVSSYPIPHNIAPKPPSPVTLCQAVPAQVLHYPRCFHAGCLKRMLWRDPNYSHGLPVIPSTPSQPLRETKDMYDKRFHSSGVGKGCSHSTLAFIAIPKRNPH